MIKNERAKMLVSFLKVGGLWFSFPESRYGRLVTAVQVLRLLQNIFGWYLCVCPLFRDGASFLFTSTAVFIPIMFTCMQCSAYFFAYRKEVEAVIKDSDSHLCSHTEEWAKRIVDEDTKLLKWVCNFLNYAMSSFIISYNVGPPIFDLIRFFLGHQDPYILPLPLSAYFDKDQGRNLKHYSIIFFCLVWFLSVAPATIGFIILILYRVSVLTSSMKIIKRRLRDLYDPEDKDVDIIRVPWNLSTTIKIHQQVIRLNDKMNEALSSDIILWKLIFNLSLCFLMLLMNQALGKDILLVILSATFSLMLSTVLVGVCFASNYLQTMSDDIFNEIYSLPWYRKSPEVRKVICMMLMESNRTLTIDYKSTFYVNLESFVQVFNTSYSYYTLMNTVKEK